MSNFQLVRYKASDTWIPETDVDGVDAIETVLADVANVDFSNGYIENASNVTAIDTPTGVLAKQLTGYSLLSAKTFYHSTQGQQTVYILWKESATDAPADPKLIIYRNDTLMIIDEGGTGITYLAKPEIITYNLVNDQLKINLNIRASYIMAEPVILNLTLVYLEETKYDSTNERAEGWHICPRWLGWAQKDYAYLYNEYAKGEVIENFEDTTYIRGFSAGGWSREVDPDDSSNYILRNYDTNRVSPIKITGIRSAGKISFDFKAVSVNYNVDAYISVALSDGEGNYFGQTLITVMELSAYAESFKSIELEPDVMKDILYTIYINTYGINDARIDNIKITPAETVVIGVYGDGQRALMFGDALGVYGGTENLRFSINEAHIDWRIVRYEVYTQASDISLLIGEVPVDGTGWTKSGYILSKDVYFFEEDDDEYHKTLNFKYNLPNDARVDNQRYIYSEITHKSRIYFVNNDYKIYQSHISTNLAIQADAFPYDEETGFGYIIVDHSKINLALANSPTNDMVIITNQGLYVYFIQPSGSGTFKQLKMGSGNITISALKSLTSVLNGEPATDGLFWIDDNGIYYYGGGLTPPENLITATHQRYWEAITSQRKSEAVGFYNPIRKEYWLYINQEFLIFELSYKKFKKYNTISGATEFMGYVNLIPRYMSDSSILSCAPAERLGALVETHYNSIEGNPEIYHKILQELYLEFGTSDTDTIITMQVYADDWHVGDYIFNSNERFSKWLSPAGLRFNKVKLRIIIPIESHIRVKEFGFSYTPDVAEPLGIVPVNIAESGYGFDYGNNYGG